MQRRKFLKTSAVGSLAMIRGGQLIAYGQGMSVDIPGGLEGADLADARHLIWGVNAALLKGPLNETPSLEALLAERDRALVLDRFHRVGRDTQPATPTQCRVAYTADALFVAFHCSESDMSFAYANLDPDLWPKANWRALNGLPAAAISSWPPYPDEVDIVIRCGTDDTSFHHFAVTQQGRRFGCRRTVFEGIGLAADEAAQAPGTMHAEPVVAFDASVEKTADAWRAFFRIPWSTLGGKPQSGFGFMPMRTRWRDGEFSSPVAQDYNEGAPTDIFIEVSFAEAALVGAAQTSLCRLPTGILRWQMPAAPGYPDLETRQRIWQMQSSLVEPTGIGNLAQRLYLTQRWMDLLTLEGFTPLRTGWALLPNDLSLPLIRQKVNAAFRKQDVARACALLDDYLAQLDAMSRWWYADGSPGNIRDDEWHAIDSVVALDQEGRSLVIRGLAGVRRIDLQLTLPSDGGVRICGARQGYWRPEDTLPLELSRTPGRCVVKTAAGSVVIQLQPFAIVFRDTAEREVLRISGADMAFRFDTKGTVIATDLRAPLDPGEVIYGFGERYDLFNQNRNVRTVWGTDDTIGNGRGLANATYKQLPIFHSTKPYMVFCNSSYRLRADLGVAQPDRYRLTQHGPVFDYYIWLGDPQEALRSYTALTGRPPVPPKWAFEPWMGRGGGAWTEGRLDDALAWSGMPLGAAITEEEEVTRRFAELDIPHSAIYAEGPSALSTDLNRFMADRGIRVLGYFRPEIEPARQRQLMPELPADALPILHCATKAQTDRLGYVDFTNSNALELCRRALAPDFALGVAGSMVDFGDWVPDDAMFSDGRRGSEMHNFYAYDYHRIVSQVFREQRGADVILYGRSAAPGTQRWLGQFGGDHPANFRGLQHVLTGAMNLSACGYSTWGSDIGGYFGFPQPAIYMRWVQFGCFSPLMRCHGITPREPWHYGEAAVANYKHLAWTRESLVDYIHNAAIVAQARGLPIMRPMPLAFPGDASLAVVGDQYMFGPDLLVAPVVTEGPHRSVVFPPGVWTSLWDGKTVQGAVTRQIAVPLDTIPVFLRPGAALPVQLSPNLRLGDSMRGNRVVALIVTPPAAPATTSFINKQDETASVRAQPVADGAVWLLEGAPDVEYILVYGVPAASAVRVDGAVLPPVKGSEPVTAGSWQADKEFNRLVIRLGPPRIDRSRPASQIEVDFQPSVGTGKGRSPW